jgi:hemoglobin
MVLDDRAVFQQLGEEGFARLVAAFYRRVRADDVIGPMYPDHDWPGAEARLRDFLIYRFGGSDRYIRERGHPRLRMRHMPFPVDQRARDRWVELMDAALAESQVPEPAAAVLRAFFASTATFMINRQGDATP